MCNYTQRHSIYCLTKNNNNENTDKNDDLREINLKNDGTVEKWKRTGKIESYDTIFNNDGTRKKHA